MKCVKLVRTGEVYRVSDLMAMTTVNMGEAVYVKKSLWKESGKKYTEGRNPAVNIKEIKNKEG